MTDFGIKKIPKVNNNFAKHQIQLYGKHEMLEFEEGQLQAKMRLSYVYGSIS